MVSFPGTIRDVGPVSKEVLLVKKSLNEIHAAKICLIKPVIPWGDIVYVSHVRYPMLAVKILIDFKVNSGSLEIGSWT